MLIFSFILQVKKDARLIFITLNFKSIKLFPRSQRKTKKIQWKQRKCNYADALLVQRVTLRRETKKILNLGRVLSPHLWRLDEVGITDWSMVSCSSVSIKILTSFRTKNRSSPGFLHSKLFLDSETNDRHVMSYLVHQNRFQNFLKWGRSPT